MEKQILPPFQLKTTKGIIQLITTVHSNFELVVSNSDWFHFLVSTSHFSLHHLIMFGRQNVDVSNIPPFD
jgi:hypothetical protein